jgi:hypothetical protein
MSNHQAASKNYKMESSAYYILATSLGFGNETYEATNKNYKMESSVYYRV